MALSRQQLAMSRDPRLALMLQRQAAEAAGFDNSQPLYDTGSQQQLTEQALTHAGSPIADPSSWLYSNTNIDDLYASGNLNILHDQDLGAYLDQTNPGWRTAFNTAYAANNSANSYGYNSDILRVTNALRAASLTGGIEDYLGQVEAVDSEHYKQLRAQDDARRKSGQMSFMTSMLTMAAGGAGLVPWTSVASNALGNVNPVLGQIAGAASGIYGMVPETQIGMDDMWGGDLDLGDNVGPAPQWGTDDLWGPDLNLGDHIGPAPQWGTDELWGPDLGAGPQAGADDMWGPDLDVGDNVSPTPQHGMDDLWGGDLDIGNVGPTGEAGFDWASLMQYAPDALGALLGFLGKGVAGEQVVNQSDEGYRTPTDNLDEALFGAKKRFGTNGVVMPGSGLNTFQTGNPSLYIP